MARKGKSVQQRRNAIGPRAVQDATPETYQESLERVVRKKEGDRARLEEAGRCTFYIHYIGHCGDSPGHHDASDGIGSPYCKHHSTVKCRSHGCANQAIEEDVYGYPRCGEHNGG